MIALQLVEVVEELFPKVGRTMILKEIEWAQNRLAKYNLFEAVVELTDVSGGTSWSLPSDFKKIKRMDFYDSDDNPLYYEDLGIEWDVEQGIVVFRSTSTSTITELPTEIDSAYMVYYKVSGDVTSENTELLINDIFLLALEAKILGRMYAKYSNITTSKGQFGTTQSKDWASVRYWEQEFIRELALAIREKNEGKDARNSILYEDFSGGYIETKKTKIYESTVGLSYPLVPIIGESLGGTKNGVNTSFTFAYTPYEDTEEIMLNGVTLKRDTDYTISGTTLTYITSAYVPIPTATDRLTANYFTRSTT